MDTLPFTENAAVIAFLAAVYTSLFCGGVAACLYLWREARAIRFDWSAHAGRLIARANAPWDALLILTLWILLTFTGSLAAQHWWIGNTGEVPVAAARWLLFYNLLVQTLVVLMVVQTSLRRNAPPDAFGFRCASLRKVIRQALLFYLAAMPIFFVGSVLWTMVMHLAGVPVEPQNSVELFMSLDSFRTRAAFFVLAMAGAPLCEEFVFRGLALPLLARHFGLWPAIVTVSVVFAVIHTHVPTILPLFCLGMAFAVSYVVSGTLAVPMIMHAIFNTVTLVCLLVSDRLS